MIPFELSNSVYNVLYKDKDYQGESDFINGILKSQSFKIKNILELGCGTGKHSSILAKDGYFIRGIDRSEGMIAQALQSKAKTFDKRLCHTEYIVADIRTYISKFKFDSAIALFHVLNYLTNDSEILETFNVTRKNIRKGGIFVFDCWHGPAILKSPPISVETSKHSKSIHVTRTCIPKLKKNSNIAQILYKYKVHNKQNNSTANYFENHNIRYFFPKEIARFLNDSGFKLKATFQWMNKDSVNDDTFSACYIAKAN